MPRALKPSEAARLVEKWAAVGVNIVTINALRSALEVDKSEAVGRVPRRSGNLAKTIRVMRMSTTKYARTGRLTAGLSAGTKKGGIAPYGRIIQEGGKIPPHVILPKKAQQLAFVRAGELVFAKQVRHPGATFPTGSGFLRVNGDRIAATIERAYVDEWPLS